MVLSSETKVGIMAGCGGSYELGCRGSLAELVRAELTRAELAQTELVRVELVRT